MLHIVYCKYCDKKIDLSDDNSIDAKNALIAQMPICKDCLDDFDSDKF